MTIGIVDYGMGNLRSVFNAFAAVEAKVEIARSPRDLPACRGIVLPGVGAFKDGMARLRENDWVDALQDQVRGERKPFLGLCLGMQLMASRGTEHGISQGLGWIEGDVVRLEGEALKIPHVGWNDVDVARESRLFAGVGERPVFYFLHSYHLRLQDTQPLIGTCAYGIQITAAIESGNLFGAQFHPEKSQKAGLQVLKNFAAEVEAWV